MVKMKKSETEIRKYFEMKYSLNFSDMKIEVKKTYLPIGGDVNWYVLEDLPVAYRIRISNPISYTLLGIGFLVGGVIAFGSLIGAISIYASLLYISIALSKDALLAHEYAHITWNERIYRYKRLVGGKIPEYMHSREEAFAAYEGIRCTISRIPKGAWKLTNILLPLYSMPPYRKYMKLFEQLEKINPEKPKHNRLAQILSKFNKLDMHKKDKQLMKDLFIEEYISLERSGMLDWIENSPAILPEKCEILEKLAKLL